MEAPEAAVTATTAPELSIVMPVFKEGEAVEPVLRALTAAVSGDARDPRRLRLRRGPDRAGHRAPVAPSCRPSAACATTSVVAS